MDLCIGWLRYPSNRISTVIPSIFPLWLRKMIKYRRCPDWCSDAINFLHIGKLPLRKTKQIHSEDMTQFPASLMDCKVWHKWPSAMAPLPRLVSLILIDWAVILLKKFCHKNSNKTVLISFLRIFSRFRARALRISSVALHRVHLLNAPAAWKKYSFQSQSNSSNWSTLIDLFDLAQTIRFCWFFLSPQFGIGLHRYFRMWEDYRITWNDRKYQMCSWDFLTWFFFIEKIPFAVTKRWTQATTSFYAVLLLLETYSGTCVSLNMACAYRACCVNIGIACNTTKSVFHSRV